MADKVLRRHYMLTMRLDLSSVDVSYLQSLSRRLDELEAVPSTLSQERALHSGAVERAYICHNECRKQQPPFELRQEPIPFDRWRDACLEGENASPELYFLALHQQQYIGVCMLESNRENPDVLQSGFTGILPAWAGRGAAKALKAHSLLCAKQRGFRYVETSNLSINRGICAINHALGFHIVRKHLHIYPIPTPVVVEAVTQ